MMIRFNPTGNRMVTSDLTGTIGVWRGINLLAVYQKEDDTYFETDVSIKIGYLYSNLDPIEIDSAKYYYKRCNH